MAPGIESIALLRVGATDDVVVSGLLDDLLKRVNRAGVVVIDDAAPGVVDRVEAAAQSTGVRVVVASSSDRKAGPTVGDASIQVRAERQTDSDG